MPAHAPGLAELLGSVSVDQFLAQHWDRSPLLVRARDAGGSERFSSVLSFDTYDRLIAETGLRGPTFRVARDGRAVQSDTWGIASLPWGTGAVRDFARPERMFDLLRDGWTVVLENADRTCASVAEVSRMLRQAFAADCFVHTFLTPGGSRAFAPHYDVQNAFVLQCGGAKHWRVHGPHIQKPLRDEGCHYTGIEPGELILDVRLEAGDLLYVPRGFVHSVAGVPDVPSLHVTFGVVPTTWHDVVQSVVRELRQASGGAGDQAIRLDTRAPVKLSETQEDWIDEQVENTLLDIDLKGIFDQLVRRRAGPASVGPTLSSALDSGTSA